MTAWRWLTPDTAPGDLVCFRVWCPAGDDYEAALRGALSPLTYSYNWEEIGAQSADTVAQAFVDAVARTYEWKRCMEIGTVIWFAGSTPGANYLACDGEQWLISEYPDLYAIIGTVFGAADSGYFRLPHIEGRSIIGGGNSPQGTNRALADVGGTETVSLNVSEMPAHTHQIPNHNHSVHTHLEGLAVAPGELPVSLPNVVPGNTGSTNGDTDSTGGGNAHENMPPFIVLNSFILAK